MNEVMAEWMAFATSCLPSPSNTLRLLSLLLSCQSVSPFALLSVCLSVCRSAVCSCLSVCVRLSVCCQLSAARAMSGLGFGSLSKRKASPLSSSGQVPWGRCWVRLSHARVAVWIQSYRPPHCVNIGITSALTYKNGISFSFVGLHHF